MKTPTTYTPYFLSLSLAIVFAMMFVITNGDKANTYAIATAENGSRINQPRPVTNKNSEPQITEGTPVFLKEDVRDEVVKSSEKLNVNYKAPLSEAQWVKKRTTTESISVNTEKPFLVLAGSYTENMILLSKHAQYKNKGYDAEVISFEGKRKRHICLGRFAKEEQAVTYAKKAGEELDIRTYVHQK